MALWQVCTRQSLNWTEGCKHGVAGHSMWKNPTFITSKVFNQHYYLLLNLSCFLRVVLDLQ